MAFPVLGHGFARQSRLHLGGLLDRDMAERARRAVAITLRPNRRETDDGDGRKGEQAKDKAILHGRRV